MTGCSNKNDASFDLLKVELNLNYGLELTKLENKSKDDIILGINNLDDILVNLEEESLSMDLNSERTILSFFESLEKEVKLYFPDLKSVLVENKGSTFTFNELEFSKVLKNGTVFVKNDEQYALFEKENRKSSNKKNDYYDLHPGDEDWKDVVDGLNDFYEGEE